MPCTKVHGNFHAYLSQIFHFFQKYKYPYLDEVAYRIEELAASDRVALRKQYGRVGDSKFWRTLQLALNERFADFNPEGLDEYFMINVNLEIFLNTLIFHLNAIAVHL